MDNKKIIKLRQVSNNSIPSTEFKNALEQKLDQNLKNSNLNFYNFFMNKKLALLATALFFMLVGLTGIFSGYLLLKDQSKSSDYVVLSEKERRTILQNIVSNNSSDLLANNVSQNSNVQPEADFSATVSSTLDSKVSAMPLVLRDRKPNTYNYTKISVQIGDKASECSAYYIPEDENRITENHEYYVDSYTNYSKYISRNSDEELNSYYLNKSTGNRSETIDFLGGEFAIKTTYNYDPIAIDAPAAVRENEVMEDPGLSAPTEPSLEEQVQGLFGPEVEILRPSNNNSYYIVEYRTSTDCNSFGVSSKPIYFEEDYDRESGGIHTLITRSYIKAKDFTIFKTENYLDEVGSNNLLDSTEIESEERQVDFEEVEDNFEFEYDVEIKEEEITSFNMYEEVDELSDETINFLNEKEIKLIVPNEIFDEGNLFAPTAVINKIERNLDTFDYKDLRTERDFYPRNNYGDELYNNVLEGYAYNSYLLNYSYNKEAQNLNIELYKKDTDHEEILRTYIYGYDDLDVEHSTIKIKIDGKDATVDIYKYTELGNSVEGSSGIAVTEPSCAPDRPGCVIPPVPDHTPTQQVMLLTYEDFVYKIDYTNYLSSLLPNNLEVTNFRTLSANKAEDKVEIKALIEKAYSTEPIPVDPWPMDPEGVACTMEAKECPDGTYVGRDPENNCEFKACP